MNLERPFASVNPLVTSAQARLFESKIAVRALEARLVGQLVAATDSSGAGLGAFLFTN